jgi:inosine-uridine nucleoside N-ribohydrolase
MERIILDVVTGLDDAVALFLAAGLQEFTIEAVIATAGNVDWRKPFENTLNILENGRDPVSGLQGSRQAVGTQPGTSR